MKRDRDARIKRHSLLRWLPETAMVVVSAGLGFAAAQYGEYRNDQRLTSRILEGLSTELAQNRAQLGPLVPFHYQWVQVLNGTRAAPDQSGLDVWFATRPPLPPDRKSPFATIRRSAWDAAIAGSFLRLLDYETTAALSEIYRAQDIVTDNVNRLASGALSETATFDPASRDASVRLLWLTLADIHAAEAMLLELYDRHLPQLHAREASDHSQ